MTRVITGLKALFNCSHHCPHAEQHWFYHLTHQCISSSIQAELIWPVHAVTSPSTGEEMHKGARVVHTEECTNPRMTATVVSRYKSTKSKLAHGWACQYMARSSVWLDEECWGNCQKMFKYKYEYLQNSCTCKKFHFMLELSFARLYYITCILYGWTS